MKSELQSLATAHSVPFSHRTSVSDLQGLLLNHVLSAECLKSVNPAIGICHLLVVFTPLRSYCLTDPNLKLLLFSWPLCLFVHSPCLSGHCGMFWLILIFLSVHLILLVLFVSALNPMCHVFRSSLLVPVSTYHGKPCLWIWLTLMNLGLNWLFWKENYFLIN